MDPNELKLSLDVISQKLSAAELEAAVWQARALLAGWQPPQPQAEVVPQGEDPEEGDADVMAPELTVIDGGRADDD